MAEPDVDAKATLRRERAALCDTLERLGPDAATLCEGWTTADLAAHLVVRERNPAAGPGILIETGPFASYTAAAMEKEKAKGYDAMLARLRSGPPAFMVATMAAVNVNENWIHHEDARRANGETARPPDPDVEAILTRVTKRMAKLQTRKLKPIGLALDLPDEMVVVRVGHPTATMTGRVGECVLYLSGRREAAEVELGGNPEAVAALRAAKLGI
ncbi:MAG: TIGR03085 family metal-binding protein [Acidimicrobiia bacterium]